MGAAGHSLPPDSAAGTVLICGRNTGALARRPPLGLASAARGTNGGASARSLLRCTSAAAPVPEPGAATAVSGRALGAAVAAACGAACSSCCSFLRTCGAKPLPPLLQPASVAGAGGVRASAARLGVAGDAASRAALVAASPVVAAGRLLQPSAAAAGAGGGAAPAARLIVAGDVASRAALVDAPPAGAAGLLQRPSAAAAGADSAALRRRAAGATAQMGKALALMSLGAATGGSGGRPTGALLTWATSAAGSLAGAAAGAASGVTAVGAAARSAATAAGPRGACIKRRRVSVPCLEHAQGGLCMLLRTLPAALYQHWEAPQPCVQQRLPLKHMPETYACSLSEHMSMVAAPPWT